MEIPTANFPPLYPLLLAGVLEIHRTEHALQVAGCLVGTVTVVLVGLLGRRIAGRAVGLVAAALTAGYPFLIAADASLMADGLYVMLVVASMVAAFWAMDRPVPVRWILLGVLLGAAALARSEGVLFALVLVIPIAAFLPAVSRPARVVFAGIALLCVVVVMAPWFVRNERVLGEPDFLSTNSATLVAGANCDSTYYGRAIGSWDFACTGNERFATLGELEYASVARSEGIEYAFDHPVRLPLVGAARLLRSFSLWDPVDLARTEEVESSWYPWQLAGWAAYLVVLPFAVFGLVLLVRRGWLRAWPLLAPIATVTITILASWGNQRFRLPGEPSLLIAAAIGVVALWRGRPATRRAAKEGWPGPASIRRPRAFQARALPTELPGRGPDGT